MAGAAVVEGACAHVGAPKWVASTRAVAAAMRVLLIRNHPEGGYAADSLTGVARTSASGGGAVRHDGEALASRPDQALGGLSGVAGGAVLPA